MKGVDELEGHGVSAGPTEIYRGDPHAKCLSDALNDVELQIVHLHGYSFFHRNARREHIMCLPTTQGWEVLQAFKLFVRDAASAVELHVVLKDLAKKRWAAARASVLKALGEHEDKPADGQFDPQEEKKWYEHKWQELEQKKLEAFQAQDLYLNPGRAWRTGQTHIFSNAGGHTMYPRGRFGEQPEPPKKSHRVNRDMDEISDGWEKYKAPRDLFLAVQRQAVEEPGVLAGFSHRHNLPELSGGLVVAASGCAYAPLVRRLDNDRLFRALRESTVFERVWPWGCGTIAGTQTVYKATPWSHLNCYKLLCTLPGDTQPWEIGDCFYWSQPNVRYPPPS